ncbi:MAG: hypothetical protein NTY99_01765 [DPANN group archaeon]|nr:hypothetical protein [DPANN group archaeon]
MQIDVFFNFFRLPARDEPGINNYMKKMKRPATLINDSSSMIQQLNCSWLDSPNRRYLNAIKGYSTKLCVGQFLQASDTLDDCMREAHHLAAKSLKGKRRCSVGIKTIMDKGSKFWEDEYL